MALQIELRTHEGHEPFYSIYGLTGKMWLGSFKTCEEAVKYIENDIIRQQQQLHELKLQKQKA
jgi:hypothetical protein